MSAGSRSRTSSAGTVVQSRAGAGPAGSALLAELDGRSLAAALLRSRRAGSRLRRAARAPGSTALRRRDALLDRLAAHVRGSASTASALTSTTTDRARSPNDSASRRSTVRCEQVWSGAVPEAEAPTGVELMRVAERLELLMRRSACEGGLGGLRHRRGGDDLARGLRSRRRDAPRGSFVALAGGEIVGILGPLRGRP